MFDSFFRILENVRQRPDHHKKVFSASVAGLITAMVAFVYLSISSLPQDISNDVQANVEKDSPLASAKKGLSDIFKSAKENTASAVDSVKSALESLKLEE